MANPKHHITAAKEVFYGAVRYARALNLFGKPGVRITPELYWHNFGAPETADADGVCAAQAIAGAADALINGALAASGVATFTTPRNIVAVSANAGDTTQTLTIYGTDYYGSVIRKTLALNGTTIVACPNAFKTVTRVAVSAAMAGNLTVGTGDVLGLPYRVDANGLLAARANNAIDAGTFVPAVTTDPATATTGDARGTFDPAVALNGANTVAVLIKIADPSTKIGAYGVLQFGSSDSA